MADEFTPGVRVNLPRTPVKAQTDAKIESLGTGEIPVLMLRDILRDLNKDVQAIYETIGPIERALTPPRDGGAGLAPAPLDFTAIVTLTGITLTWGAPNAQARLYEIRRSAFTVWETASFVTRTPSLSVNLDPLPTGSYYFLIKTIDILGNPSTGFETAIATIIAPGKPVVTVAIIDNNVLLTWTTPTASFSIDRFRLYRNGALFGSLRANFTSTFETVAGLYIYGLEAIDIAGNVGPIGEVTAEVNTPPDYQLASRIVSDLNGTKDNVIRSVTPSLIACVDDAITWEQHFTTRSWNTIQDQLTAGYPIYAQPTVLTGWYEEIIDYGLLIQNTIATVTYSMVQIVGDVSVVVRLAWSTDGIAYTPFVNGASQFVPSFQYLKVRLEFTGSSDKALAELTALTITLDVKREVDGGELIAYSGGIHDLVDHTNGTPVSFNKVFKDVNSITATCDSIEPIIVIYDFLDIPNPIGFKVFALDSTGNRVTYLVSWKARGIV
jgi:hypothetical protein